MALAVIVAVAVDVTGLYIVVVAVAAADVFATVVLALDRGSKKRSLCSYSFTFLVVFS